MTAKVDTPQAAKTPADEVQTEVARRNYVRAAEIAAGGHLSAADVRSLRVEALWQMASNRNAPGTRRLARQYGISKAELKQLFAARARQLRDNGQIRSLDPCYDVTTGRYLSLEEWQDLHSQEWDQESPKASPWDSRIWIWRP